MNQYGAHTFSDSEYFDTCWSQELKMVAKHGWMLSRMCPSDIVAFCNSADSLVGSRMVLHGHDMLQFYIAGFLRLPYAVDQWRTFIEEIPTAGTYKSAAWLSTSSLQLALSLQKDSFFEQAQWEHEQLSMPEQQYIGPVAFFKRMRMLDELDDLSESMHAYNVNSVRQEEVWTELVEIAEDFDKRNPEGILMPMHTHEQTHSFVFEAKELVQSFAEGGKYKGNTKEGAVAKYLSKHIVRMIIMWTMRRTPSDIWNNWTFDQLKDIMPELYATSGPSRIVRLNKKTPSGILKALPPHLDAKRARSIFGVSFFMLTYWAHKFHEVTKKHINAFEKAGTLQVKMEQLVKLLTKKSMCEPSLNTLAREYLITSKIRSQIDS